MAATRTVNLADLLTDLDFQASGDPRDIPISGITADSRQAGPGVLFVALPGLKADGHDFVDQALARGCAAVMIERNRAARPADFAPTGALVVEVNDCRQALGRVAAAFYGHPARDLRLIGITGTNGKTTCSYLVESILQAAGHPCGVVGTVNYRYRTGHGEKISLAAPYTTPEPVALQQLLGRMRDSGVTHVVMEVSSHGLAQERLAGLFFDVAAFTNLSRDHLDFHIGMDHYFHSKKKLFLDHLRPGGTAVLSLRGPAPDGETGHLCPEDSLCWGRRLADSLGPARISTCGLAPEHDVHPVNFAIDFMGIKGEIATPLGPLAIRSPLIGLFNLRNILTAVTIGLAVTEDLTDAERLAAIRTGIDNLAAVPGRLERVTHPDRDDRGCQVFVDYAHTPDALENVLATLRNLEPARLICVFGCGGDRDAGKRPLMGEAAGRLADVVLVTSDNPRSEPPERILAEIEAGLGRTALGRGPAAAILNQEAGQGYDVIIDRRQAIDTAIRYCRPDDVVLISGKGHEEYQISGSVRTFFDDRLEARRALEAKRANG